MRIFGCTVALLMAAVPACFGQWEVGAVGGWGFAKDLTVKSAAGAKASAGFSSGGAWGVFGGDNTYRYISGEARYLFRFSDPRLSAGGTTVPFSGHTHLIGGAFLLHAKPTEARFRPFISVGGGVKVFVGTGIERAFQPLSNFAVLSHTRETQPMVDVGVGFKYTLTKYLQFRGEFRDTISPAPTKVIAAVPGSSIGGWMQDFIPLGGLVLTWH